MEKFDLYKDIQLRTGGEIYVGIVGPVRTGKSTFVRKVAELLILPELEENHRMVARDEMPSSASGKMITTVEPKFIPRDAADMKLMDGSSIKIRLVDCVGFMVPGAEGAEFDGQPRMVKTPWQKQPMSFTDAARFGTQKVISDHATVGIVITSDGSFGELPRNSFLDAEREAIMHLKKIGKPFVVIVNSAKPYSPEARNVSEYISRNYGVHCMVQNCEQMGFDEIQKVFEQFLLEFPIRRVVFQIPRWAETLDHSHWLKQSLFQAVKDCMQSLRTVRDINDTHMTLKNDYIKKTKVEQIDLSSGDAEISVTLQESLYYTILSEMTGTDIKSEYHLISMIKEMSALKQEYEEAASAMDSVRQTGYGVISPQKHEIHMEEPVIIKQGSRYGVKIKASCPSIHLIRAEIETEISPIVGREEQARDLIAYMKQNSENEEGKWNALIFGKSLEQMVEEGIQNKLASVGEESQQKLQDAMCKIVNSSKGRFFCIIL